MTTQHVLIFVLGLYVGQWLTIWGLLRIMVGIVLSVRQTQTPMLPPIANPDLIIKVLDLLEKK